MSKPTNKSDATGLVAKAGTRTIRPGGAVFSLAFHCACPDDRRNAMDSFGYGWLCDVSSYNKRSCERKRHRVTDTLL